MCLEGEADCESGSVVVDWSEVVAHDHDVIATQSALHFPLLHLDALESGVRCGGAAVDDGHVATAKSEGGHSFRTYQLPVYCSCAPAVLGVLARFDVERELYDVRLLLVAGRRNQHDPHAARCVGDGLGEAGCREVALGRVQTPTTVCKHAVTQS